MNNFTVDVLTPYAIIAKDVPAEALLVPTGRGQINVLKDHTHVVTKLDTGMLSIFGGADDPDRFFGITTGICKILDQKVTILANVAEEAVEIDKERAEAALLNAKQRLQESQGLSDDEIEKYRRKEERAKLRIQLHDFVRSRNL
ncbi:ATP synthase F1 subunit epsilon [Halobacteriovorax marinus]|uniref:ATP synthase F1 subunit epsilon n=1 Tax=Halobacteriovorax marinus TaxID=97084 RepID=UPI000BC2D227|nr:ATP synthase F1 subunit epsilon [Halobacteriovorax marinus]ATH09436.1 ATP synthase F1 subunit epsilon [Halobacteriovorax marinus]